MSRLSNKLEKLLSDRLEYPCTIYFDRRCGWLFKTDKTYPQRIGYTYTQSVKFINGPTSIWDWLKKELK